jgi:hypothetical protein
VSQPAGMTAAEQTQEHPRWSDLLEQQDRVISRRQALLGGLSEDQWQWRLDSGRWQPVLPGVAVAHTGEVTDGQRAWAAVLYAREGAHLSADAALLQLGMKLPSPREIHVVTSRELRPQWFNASGESAAVRLVPHRLKHADQWKHPVKQPATLRAAPAALHAAAWAVSDRAAEWRVAAAVQQRLVRPADLRRALDQMPQVHRHALMGEVLDDVEFGAHAASELDFLRFLRRHALPPPDRLQRPVRAGKICYLDGWWERPRVSAEIDGAHHRLVGAWDDDALRANDVVLVERHDRILLLRFTRGNMRHDEARVAEQLRAVLL